LGSFSDDRCGDVLEICAYGTDHRPGCSHATRRYKFAVNIAELPELLQKNSNHSEQNTGVQSGNEDDQ
jgi:hypothetical protein